MRRVIRYCVGFLLVAFIIFEAVVMSILLLPGGTYDTSYQATIQDKYDLLIATESPKIILVGGSSLAFGINADAISEATGYPVVNLGLHAGFGNLFITELAKANIGKGDIVLLGYEYNWPEESSFTTIGTDLVMSGIDNRIEMYRYVSVSQWRSILGYLFTYASGKNTFEEADGLYSRNGFSENGNQMTTDRPEAFEPAEGFEITVTERISEESIDYLRAFKDDVESRGASVYFIAAPYARDGITNLAGLDRIVSLEEEQIGIPYISEMKDYAFDHSLLFDTKYHCNTIGEQRRTQLLIQDLERAGIAR